MFCKVYSTHWKIRYIIARFAAGHPKEGPRRLGSVDLCAAPRPLSILSAFQDRCRPCRRSMPAIGLAGVPCPLSTLSAFPASYWS
ncbi:hypothetical protein COLSTE_00083 [Collinsella stercoris DSM 13279]|uniref:Uncharacterized protein n=1 Tax=Collinsella stercoris DSM 13279 TaxID=445975 RepID=B6G7P3_9ACTN|nr:hypothetical protein COLSTE_00083 [Collinsella stercoris DSM 13279]